MDSLELGLSLTGGFQKSISVVLFIANWSNCLFIYSILMKPDVDDSM